MFLDSFVCSCTTWKNNLSGIKRIIVLFKGSWLKQQISISNSYTSTLKLMDSASEKDFKWQSAMMNITWDLVGSPL